MTTNESLRILDMVSHICYAAILLWHTSQHPSDFFGERFTRTMAFLMSVFLAFTVWHYGRTTMFLCVHNLWQIMVVFSAYYALRKL